MRYLYYPGCTLTGTSREYDLATREVMAALGADLVEIEGWTCCGANAAEAASRLLALTLAARNLALAEKTSQGSDILTPCSACYLNLKKTETTLGQNPGLWRQINSILAESALEYRGLVRVRHLLDVLAKDYSPHYLNSLVKNPLSGLVLAPYYGCQCLRPLAVFDDPERPQCMEPILRAIGGAIHPWEMGGRCCGASNMTTKYEDTLPLVSDILQAARGAGAVVTVCPMCQMNLEAHQDVISKKAQLDLHLPIYYLPQVLGLALGLAENALGLDLNLSPRLRLYESR